MISLQLTVQVASLLQLVFGYFFRTVFVCRVVRLPPTPTRLIIHVMIAMLVVRCVQGHRLISVRPVGMQPIQTTQQTMYHTISILVILFVRWNVHLVSTSETAIPIFVNPVQYNALVVQYHQLIAQ